MIPAELKGPAVRTITSTVTGVAIPVISARGLVFSAWTPSPEELAAMAAGSPVWLVQRGPYIPDMTMRVGKEFDIIPHDLMKSAIEEALPGGDAYEQAVKAWKPTDLDRRLGRLALISGVLLGFALLMFAAGKVFLWLVRG